MNQKLKYALGGAVLIALIVGFSLNKEKKKPLAWQEVAAEEGEFKRKISATGSVTPLNLIVVTAPINGRIDQILVEDGSIVKKKQVLAWMSSQDRAALLDALETSGNKENDDLKRMYLPTPIVAPEAGQVILKTVAKGQNVGPESTLFQISDRLVFVAKVDETDIGKVQVNQPVQIRVDAFPEDSIEGITHHVVHQSSLSNNITTYDVYIEAKSPAALKKLRSGMSMTADFILNQNKQALLLPSFIAEGQQNARLTLMVKNSVGDPAPREVRVGSTNGESVEVLEGLKAGDVVMYHAVDTTANKSADGPLSLFGKKKK